MDPPRVLLVIDDDGLTRRLIRRVFLQRGWTVVEATDAHDGLRAIEAMLPETPDVILSDVDMRGGSGVELADGLRRRFPHLTERVIFQTGGGLDPRIMARFAAAGHQVYSKPFNFAALARVVADVAARP